MPTRVHLPADRQQPGLPESSRGERLVSALAVTAVACVAVTAAVVQSGTLLRLDQARSALGQPAAPVACAECGVVEAAVPLGPLPVEAGATWQVRIRMDDGSLRTVRQRSALAAGSRVTMAGGSVRVLSNGPGQG